MKLFAWVPKSDGPYAFYVMANSMDEATHLVNRYITENRLFADQYAGWGTDRYLHYVVEPGEVITQSTS